ncbi:MAG: hypothetical protein JNM14_07140 [Ferruginibacter sp.]|nr:hypothetical protein [Ferruginibacter sp.]
MRMLFCLLLFSSTVPAQSFFFSADSAFVSTIELPSKQPFDTARAYLKVQSPYIYIISDKDLYDHFGYNAAMKFYQFNFNDYHILGRLQCRQCLLVCNHDRREKKCHRNACHKEWVWVKRDNKKAFTTVASYVMPWSKAEGFPRYNDTLIDAPGDTSIWYTTGSGDCFARFEYAVVADKYQPALILKEWNYWGGCRAAGGKPAAVIFKEPAGILYKTKRTILMQR